MGYDTNMRRKGNENFSSKKGMAYDGWEKKVIHFGGFKLFFFFSSVFHINQRGGGGGGGGGVGEGDAIHSLESSLVSVYKLLELVLFKENELIQIYNEFPNFLH